MIPILVITLSSYFLLCWNIVSNLVSKIISNILCNSSRHIPSNTTRNIVRNRVSAEGVVETQG